MVLESRIEEAAPGLGKRCLLDMLAYKHTLIILLVPILGLPLVFTGDDKWKCAYVVVVMGAYWMFEVLPLAVTALIPTFAFPILGVLSATDTCYKYLSQINFLFIGGLIMALAVEKCNLHQRLALKVLTIVGSQPKWIMLGFMSVTAFLSMWMSNTATTAMMVPIAQSVIVELASQNVPGGGRRRRQSSVDSGNSRAPKAGNSQLGSRQSLSKIEEDVPLQDIDAVDLMQPATSKEAISLQDDQEIELKAGQKKLNILKDGIDKNEKRRRKHSRSVDVGLVHPASSEEKPSELNLKTLNEKEKLMAKGLLISIAFAANIGGTGTITGTPPNLVLMDQFANRYKTDKVDLSFLTWMEFAVPLMLVAVLICWFSLAIVFLDRKDIFNTLNPVQILRRRQQKKTTDAHNAENGIVEVEVVDPVKNMIHNKYNSLPKISFAEWSVLILFLILLTLWIMRDPKIIPGYSVLFKHKFYADSTSAMLMSALLFVFPDKKPDFLCWRKDKKAAPKVRGALMDWPTMQHKFPWSVVLLLGGGFALAEGVKRSGLSAAVGDGLLGLEGLPLVLLQLCCVICTMFVTNICSNTVTAVIFLQIVAQMAEKLDYHPLAFMLPTTLACSYAFLLPVATPPNAIAFASGLLTVADLMKAGGMISLISVFLIMGYMNTYALLFWAVDGPTPLWALGKQAAVNGTL